MVLLPCRNQGPVVSMEVQTCVPKFPESTYLMHCFRNTGIGLCFIRTKYINITSTSFHTKREWNTSATKLISQWKFLTSTKHRDVASFYYFKWKDDSHNGLFQCNCPKSRRLISWLISPYKQGPSRYSLAGQTFVAGKNIWSLYTGFCGMEEFENATSWIHKERTKVWN